MNQAEDALLQAIQRNPQSWRAMRELGDSVINEQIGYEQRCCSITRLWRILQPRPTRGWDQAREEGAECSRRYLPIQVRFFFRVGLLPRQSSPTLPD
jgi:hypothetical protein